MAAGCDAEARERFFEKMLSNLIVPAPHDVSAIVYGFVYPCVKYDTISVDEPGKGRRPPLNFSKSNAGSRTRRVVAQRSAGFRCQEGIRLAFFIFGEGKIVFRIIPFA